MRTNDATALAVDGLTTLTDVEAKEANGGFAFLVALGVAAAVVGIVSGGLSIWDHFHQHRRNSCR